MGWLASDDLSRLFRMMTPAFAPPVPPLFDGVLVLGTFPPRVSSAIATWASTRQLSVTYEPVARVDRDLARAQLPALIILGADSASGDLGNEIHALKGDSRLQTVPLVVAGTLPSAERWFELGADEVLSDTLADEELLARLTAALRRSVRDVQVNPSTRLPGAEAIAEAISERLRQDEPFGACYADLDHFKEFNDRYGYAKGDDVIRTVAELLAGVVEQAAGPRGFVGHIGGDDFLFLVPLASVASVCDLLVQRADEILPPRYSPHDRQAGYFFGKDRRGRLDRVPLMTLSIGVVTNERRKFTHAAQVSELATEMKTYAKALPGSVWAMDRRSDGESANPPEEKHQ